MTLKSCSTRSGSPRPAAGVGAGGDTGVGLGVGDGVRAGVGVGLGVAKGAAVGAARIGTEVGSRGAVARGEGDAPRLDAAVGVLETVRISTMPPRFLPFPPMNMTANKNMNRMPAADAMAQRIRCWASVIWWLAWECAVAGEGSQLHVPVEPLSRRFAAQRRRQPDGKTVGHARDVVGNTLAEGIVRQRKSFG